MKKIKVRIPLKSKIFNSENMWVEKLSNGVGKIRNIPYFATQYKYGDIVKFDPETMIVQKVISDGGYTRTRFCKFTGDRQLENEYWFDKGYIIEFISSNMIVVCRPRDKKEWVKRKKINWRTSLPTV